MPLKDASKVERKATRNPDPRVASQCLIDPHLPSLTNKRRWCHVLFGILESLVRQGPWYQEWAEAPEIDVNFTTDGSPSACCWRWLQGQSAREGVSNCFSVCGTHLYHHRRHDPDPSHRSHGHRRRHHRSEPSQRGGGQSVA